jgi:nucleoredoxin
MPLRHACRLLPWLCCALLAAVPAPAASLEELAAAPERWPTEVAVLSATRGTIIRDDKPAGAMLVGAGRVLAVAKISAQGVTGRIGGTLVLVPADKTDLAQRTGGAAASPPAEVAAAPSAAPDPAPATEAAAPAKRRVPAMMQRLLAQKLVRSDNGRLRAVDDAAMGEVRYFALYYSASWCGPCREFTPQLVRAYHDLKARHPEFEIVFVSADNSAGDMAGYMKEDRMPWLAVKYDLRDNKIVSYSGPGIPCLVLVDAQGRVLSDSYEGDNYVGPQKVLADTRRILAEKR